MKKELLKMKYRVPMPPEDASKIEFILWRFKELGITSQDLVQIAYNKQREFIDNLTFEDVKIALKKVLSKREIQHTLITGISLDVLAENNLLPNPLEKIVKEDRGTYGVDELLMDSSTLYGTIALTNALGLDTHKSGIIKKIDELGKNSEYTTTFLDDLLCMLVGCTEGYLAHKYEIGHDTSNENSITDEKLINNF